MFGKLFLIDSVEKLSGTFLPCLLKSDLLLLELGRRYKSVKASIADFLKAMTLGC